MSVYVDRLMNHGWKLYGRVIQSCHLTADEVAELHIFAQKIGLKPGWFQPTSKPHYDLTPNKRMEALKYGAIER